MPNYNAARERVFDLLADCNWHSTIEIIQVGGTEGTRRLRELRETQPIEKRPMKGSNMWEYRIGCSKGENENE